MKKFRTQQICILKNEDGLSLIVMALFVLGLGLLFSAGAQLYDIWKPYSAATQTQEKMQRIQDEIQNYVYEHGRYPCPAPLNAPFDAAGFGQPVGIDEPFHPADPDGKTWKNCGGFEVDGRPPTTKNFVGTGYVDIDDPTEESYNEREVITGAVPVRSLNLPDDYIFDGHRQRFVYAVTTEFTHEDAPLYDGVGGIKIIDSQGNDSTAQEGNIVSLVLSMGYDDNGAYSANGALLSPCNPNARSGENCDFDTSADFMNTLLTSTNETDNTSFYVHKMTYRPGPGCVNSTSAIPKDVGFILDTSGSMRTSDGSCPDSLVDTFRDKYGDDTCTRMDAAHWALRRAMPARLESNFKAEKGITNFNGFMAYNSTSNVQSAIESQGIEFDNPDPETNPDYNIDDELEGKATELEDRMSSMCPSGSTPLGIHIDAISQHMNEKDQDALADGDGDGAPDGYENGDPAKPKDEWPYRKIIILSDGLSNNGRDPIDVALEMQARDPNIQIDIIDVIGTDVYCYDYDKDTTNDCDRPEVKQPNHPLRKVVEPSKGHYYPASDPYEMLKAFYKALGTCAQPTEPPDERHCH